jgi:hypothetical protein
MRTHDAGIAGVALHAIVAANTGRGDGWPLSDRVIHAADARRPAIAPWRMP